MRLPLTLPDYIGTPARGERIIRKVSPARERRSRRRVEGIHSFTIQVLRGGDKPRHYRRRGAFAVHR